jgi:poly(A) polymerase
LDLPSSSASPEIPSELQILLDAISRAGHSCWLSGEVVRALVLGADGSGARRVDILTTAPEESIAGLVRRFAEEGGTRSVPGGVRMALAKSSSTIQITTLRTSLPTYRWFQEQRLEGIERDLATREITLHAIAIASDGTLVDPHGGVEDLRAGQIKTIVPHGQVFRENGRWLLKVAQHVAWYGFPASAGLLQSAIRDAGGIMDVAPREWCVALGRILMSDHVMDGLNFLREGRILGYILPEIAAMVGFHESCRVHHKDLWAHTIQVIHQTEKNPHVRWAALMHDIGKVPTRTVNRDGKVHFFRHEELGAHMFRGIAHRLEMSEEDEERIQYIIRNHSRVNLYESSWTDSAVRRLIRDCGDRLDELLAFSRADFTTKRASRAAELRRQLVELDERIASISAEDARRCPLPSGLGQHIMKHFQVGPGRHVGDARAWLEAEVEAGRVPAGEEPEVYLEHMEAHRDQVPLPAAPSDAS